MYNRGCSNALTCLAEKCLSPMYMPTWLSGESLSPAYMITWPSEKRLSPVKHSWRCGKDPADVSLLPSGAESHRCHGCTWGTIITRRRGKPDGTLVLFLVA
jgi:hypothetical protein